MRYKSTFCILACLYVFLSPTEYCRGEDWRFRTLTEMRQTLPKYLKSPHALYYIIIRAKQQRLSADLCLQLRGIRQKNPQDMNIASAYAFSQFITTNPITLEMARHGLTPQESEVQSQQAESKYYRDEALKNAPNDREILLEAGISLISSGGMSEHNAEKARLLLAKAVKQAPKWADTHYWLGVCDAQLGINAVAYRKTLEYPEYYRKCIVELRESERIEPGLHTDCVRHYVDAYYYTKQWGKLLASLDEYVKIRPDMAQQGFVRIWRKEAQDHIKAQQ